MARQSKAKDDFMEDELAAAFLDDGEVVEQEVVSEEVAVAQEWEDDDVADAPGQLAVDVYETPERLYIKARTAGVEKDALDVSIADNVLTISGTLSSGDEVEAENYYVQECYWGQFKRSLTLPVTVKEDGVEANLEDGVLTVSFEKVKQDTVKKIPVN